MGWGWDGGCTNPALVELLFCVLCSCSGCGAEVSREDSFYELLLNIQGHKELGECLNEFFQVRLFFSVLSARILHIC